MEAIGGVLVLAGGISIFIGCIMILIEAFKKSILWGLGTVFIAIVGLIFIVVHWDVAKRGFLVAFGGWLMAIIGMALSGMPLTVPQ